MHDKRYQNLGLAVAHFREEKGLTQPQLAQKTDVSRAHIQNIENYNKKTQISLSMIFCIANALDISVSDLFVFAENIPT